MRKRLKVLFLAAWYPTDQYPVHAIFVMEHAHAASLQNDVVMLYPYSDERLLPWKHVVSENDEYGLRTIRVRFGKYLGVLGHLKRLLFRNKRARASGELDSSGDGGLVRAIETLLVLDKIILGELMYHWWAFVGLRRLLKSGWRPDVIHSHVFTAGVPAVVFGRVYGIPVVITEHWTDIPRRLLTLDQRLKLRFAMKRADAVLPVSEPLQQAIEAYGVRRTFRIVPNPVNTVLFSLAASHGHTGSGDTKRLLTVTRFMPAKGVNYLLQAIGAVRARRTDFVLDLVGSGPEAEQCVSLARRIGIEDVVRFRGSLDRWGVAAYMRDCAFFVQASLVETFGVVYIEAMSCGKPVIACDIPGPRELVNEERGILVPPRDVDGLAKAIDFMLDHFHEYSSERIARFVAERFSSEIVGGMLDGIYREIVHTRTGMP